MSPSEVNGDLLVSNVLWSVTSLLFRAAASVWWLFLLARVSCRGNFPRLATSTFVGTQAYRSSAFAGKLCRHVDASALAGKWDERFRVAMRRCRVRPNGSDKLG